MLYSAANGSWQPWAEKQAIRLGVAALDHVRGGAVDLRIWLKIAYGFYGVVLLLLVAVELRGAIGMGAQRWIDLGVIQLQPSELMKIAAMMALARYFNGVAGRGDRPAAAPGGAGAHRAGAGGAGAEAARSRHGADAGAGRRRDVLPRGRAAVAVRAAIAGRVPRRGADRVALPARLSEEPHLYLPRSRERSPGRGLSQPAIEDRDRLGRRLRQGLPDGDAVASQLPAGAADRLHLHHAGRGMGPRRRPGAARALPPGRSSTATPSRSAAATISDGSWRSASPSTCSSMSSSTRRW